MAKTMILKCTCEQSYQDSQHGMANRLHKWDEQAVAWCCSVCGSQRVLKAEPEKKVPKK